MTLREKLCLPFDGLPTETIDKLEKIVDDEMQEFSAWLLGKLIDNADSIKLLEIYKTKKKL